MVVSWKDWTDAIARGVSSVDDEQLAFVAELISASSIVLTAGNGGSSCLASHAAQAFSKPDYKAGGGVPAVCLTDNAATLTAHANDGGWPDALVEVAAPFLEIGVLSATLVLFSSSGRSPNIVKLAEFAREREYDVVAFTGFDGEPLKSLATVAIHVDSKDYEVVEPVHDALLHRVQYHLRESVK